MEVVAATPGSGSVPPFHNHDVHEWSRIDSLTGCLERARLETDHWTATTQNSSHNYRKVVDCRARTRPDGNVQQEAKRQLEVFNSQIPGGRLQVIKSHTVSSSRWTSTSPIENVAQDNPGFENLQLAINPLDLSTEKSKAHLGRHTRRPPSRSLLQNTATANLYRVSQICNEFHNAALQHAFGTRPVEERENGDGIEIVDVENDSSSSLPTRSSSNENLTDQPKSIKSTEDLEDLEQLQNWRRASKIRRSLQFPTKQNGKSYQNKPDDLPQNTGSVRRIREDLEKGRRLNAALRGNNFDLDALDQILQTISGEESAVSREQAKQEQKEQSFVTVESIKEMKGKLKKTPSFRRQDEEDDGIDTECSPKNVRSYIYGMEKNGTGSLESRKHNLSLHKNEDWYNRRKSYGFEKVTQQEDPISKSKSKVESSTDSGICRSSEIVAPQLNNWKKSSKVNISDWNKKEGTTITIPIVSKDSPVASRKKFFERELGDGTSYSVESWKKDSNEEIKRHSIAVDESKYVKSEEQPKFRRTSLAVNTEDDDNMARRKRVEFCKTEVHFAADSGKVNIVETDEKPPPTNNFRRRRRYSGLIPNEEFNTNGLPVFQFGDQIANEDLDDTVQPLGIVTVNNTNIYSDTFLAEIDQEKDNFETEVPKSILKNKPIKPRPYILGETPSEMVTPNHHVITPWGVKLRSVDSNPPIWTSTVTVRNTFFDQPQENKTEKLNSIRISTPNMDVPSYCSVQDRIKQVEDMRTVENKGYSTKINFGNGGATVVENENANSRNTNGRSNSRSATFPRHEETIKDTLYPTKNDRDRTTTTKITIDLNRATLANDEKPLKSTSLILNTLKTDNLPTSQNERTEPRLAVPQQLEELKRLYEDVYSDSETDKEVQSFMTKTIDRTIDDDSSSVVSGSWTRARAYKNVSQYARTAYSVDDKKRLHAQLDKDMDSMHNIIKVNPMIQQRYNEPSQKAQRVPSKPKSEHQVLRQPKKSEMAYFGVPVSPQITRKAEKKDLRTDRQRNEHKTEKKIGQRPPQKVEKKQQPIYENIEEAKRSAKYQPKREFDSTILDELTKAADQILQAVSGYTDEDHRYTTDDERSKKNVREPLETISETTSWKQSSKKQQTPLVPKQKLKRTSSNSSAESVNKERQSLKSVSSAERRKKTVETSSKAITKARRLQRASSREALLQSHGSSSEDLAIEVPLRKPRLVRKTKTAAASATVTSTSSVEVKKKERSRDNDRLPQVALPEIRHKTAVSTIRSTAEKAKDNKLKSADLKKRSQKSKDPKVLSTSSRPERSTKDGGSYQPHKEKISTANIKKCSRYDGATKR